MRNLLISVLALFVVSVSYGQSQPDIKYIAKTLSAGTAMSARTVADALDDTTQTIRVGGFARVYVHLISATNDSVNVTVSYQVSNDGSTWSAFTKWDSLATSGTVGANKAFELPAGGMGGEYVRIRVEGSDSALRSANPSTTVTTVIRKKYY